MYLGWFQVISLFVFMMPSDSGEKITLGISAMLNMTVRNIKFAFVNSMNESKLPFCDAGDFLNKGFSNGCCGGSSTYWHNVHYKFSSFITFNHSHQHINDIVIINIHHIVLKWKISPRHLLLSHPVCDNIHNGDGSSRSSDAFQRTLGTKGKDKSSNLLLTRTYHWSLKTDQALLLFCKGAQLAS